MADNLKLSDRIEALVGPIPFSVAEEMFRAGWLEPERGPWYWRNVEWSKWNHTLLVFVHRLNREGWLWSLQWLYEFGRLPDMIHSDPKKAFAAALRERGL